MRHDLVTARLEQRQNLLVRYPGSDRGRAGRRRRWRLQALARFGFLDVTGDDAAMRASTVDTRQLDAGFLGQTTGQRR